MEADSMTLVFMIASASIMFLLGFVHILYTFIGEKFKPRDAEVQKVMALVSPVITRETTMWNAWIGFNASHSIGVILFGVIYGYLALVEPDILFQSHFLLGFGILTLSGYVVLGKLYWFKIPFVGILASLTLFICSLITFNL